MDLTRRRGGVPVLDQDDAAEHPRYFRQRERESPLDVFGVIVERAAADGEHADDAVLRMRIEQRPDQDAAIAEHLLVGRVGRQQGAPLMDDRLEQRIVGAKW